MTVYFSVDVESTGTNPFNPAHQLTNVGAVAIDEDGLILGSWYARLEYDSESWDPDTKSWWLQQNQKAKQEILSTKDRWNPTHAAQDFHHFVFSVCQGRTVDVHDVVFVANPASFDFGWIQRWYTEAGIRMPFSHRTMCLRSVAFGGQSEFDWKTFKPRNHKPGVPHHALHDAQAQAFDFLGLL